MAAMAMTAIVAIEPTSEENRISPFYQYHHYFQYNLPMFSRLKRPRPELRRSPIPPEPPPPSRELIPLNNCEVDSSE